MHDPRPSASSIVRPVARRIIGFPGRVLPYSLQRPALSMALNEAFRAPLRHGELEFLQGRRVRIEVTDLCLDWLIEVMADRFRAIDRRLDEDVRISGDALAFLLLATRRADPDTLFFHRRIRVQGDTELGLGVKNTMDGMDWDELPAPLKKLLRGTGLLIAKVQRLRNT